MHDFHTEDKPTEGFLNKYFATHLTIKMLPQCGQENLDSQWGHSIHFHGIHTDWKLYQVPVVLGD